MPKSFVQNAFQSWLKENRSKFDHPPMRVRYIKGRAEFCLKGVSNAIAVSVHSKGYDVLIRFRGETVDMLASHDVAPIRDGAGYRCDLCVDYEHSEHPDLPEANTELYSSKADFYERHNFDDMLEWVNRKLRENACIVVGDRCAWLSSKEKIGEETEYVNGKDIVAMIPVLDHSDDYWQIIPKTLRVKNGIGKIKSRRWKPKRPGRW